MFSHQITQLKMEKTDRWAVLESEMLGCCGSTIFAKEMVKASPFDSLSHAISSARDIWLNKVDVRGYLQAFDAHPQIGKPHSARSVARSLTSTAFSWSKSEQSTALATVTSSTLEELAEYNGQYQQKFGFIFITCASGRSSDDMLAELKNRILNKPIKELEIAVEEQMKITELRMEKLFLARSGTENTSVAVVRVGIIGGHITESPVVTSVTSRRRPITTHVLDVSQGKPARGVEVSLEIWKGLGNGASFKDKSGGGWEVLGWSETDVDGRSGELLNGDDVEAGTYRISFNTRSYCPASFFPYVSILFEIREDQRREHFHVPLLFSPFSFTTYRGS